MKTQYNLIMLLALSSSINASEQPQAPGTLKNCTESDIKIIARRAMYQNEGMPPWLRWITRNPLGQLEEGTFTSLADSIIDSGKTIEFCKELRSLRTNKSPEYAIYPQLTYAIQELREEGSTSKRHILTIVQQDGTMREAITVINKQHMTLCARLIQDYIAENTRVNNPKELTKLAANYKELRDQYPNEAQEIEDELQLTNLINGQGREQGDEESFFLIDNSAEQTTEHAEYK